LLFNFASYMSTKPCCKVYLFLSLYGAQGMSPVFVVVVVVVEVLSATAQLSVILYPLVKQYLACVLGGMR